MAIPREPYNNSNNTDFILGLRRDYTLAPQFTRAYLIGVLHDATVRTNTFRVASKYRSFCNYLQKEIKKLGFGAWIYKEGKDRNLWIVDFSRSVLKNVKIKSKRDKVDYLRGYFDTDGSVSKNPDVRYYIYFAQKDKSDLRQAKAYLEELGIECGKLHNPSKSVDANYWRFYVKANSYEKFAEIINSSHPEKRKYLRTKI